MVGAEFVSSWLKIRRAGEHLDILKSELSKWRDTRPYGIRRTHSSDGGRHSLVLEVNKAPDLDRWSVIGGDCVHNLRSALDHVVYALAIQNSGKNPPPKHRSLQFPIFETDSEFNEKLPKIAALSIQAQTFIKRAQPYQGRHPVYPSPLSVLNEFDNSDKHRLLNVALTHMGSGEFTFARPLVGKRSDIYWVRTPIQHGAEVAFFTIDPPQFDVKYKFRVAIDITVAHVPGPTGVHVSPLVGMLETLLVEVKRIVQGVIIAA